MQGFTKKISNLTYSRRALINLSPPSTVVQEPDTLMILCEIPKYPEWLLWKYGKNHTNRGPAKRPPRTHGWQPIKPALNPSRTVVQFATWKAKPRTPWCSSLHQQEPFTNAAALYPGSSFCSVSKYPLRVPLPTSPEPQLSQSEELQPSGRSKQWTKHPLRSSPNCRKQPTEHSSSHPAI